MSEGEIVIKPSFEAYIDDYLMWIIAMVSVLLLYIHPLASAILAIIALIIALLNGFKKNNWLLIGIIIGYAITILLYFYMKTYVGLAALYFLLALLIEMKYVEGIKYVIIGKCDELAKEAVLKIGPLTIKEEKGSRMTIMYVELKSNILSNLLKHKQLTIVHRNGTIVLKGVPSDIADKVYNVCKYKKGARERKAS